MTNCKNNRGAQRTRRAMKTAFFRLAAEKPLRQITVAELVDAAEVSRGTFYLHYQDIYDLAESAGVELLEQVDAKLSDVLNAPELKVDEFPLLREAFRFIKEHATEARFFLSDDGPASFRRGMGDLFLRVSMKAIEGRFAHLSANELEIFEAYTQAGVVGVVQSWMNSGFAADADELAVTVGRIITAGLTR